MLAFIFGAWPSAPWFPPCRRKTGLAGTQAATLLLANTEGPHLAEALCSRPAPGGAASRPSAPPVGAGGLLGAPGAIPPVAAMHREGGPRAEQTKVQQREREDRGKLGEVGSHAGP